MLLVIIILICSLYLIASTLGVAKWKSSLSDSQYFIVFILISTVTQIFQGVLSYNGLSSFYLYHTFHLSIFVLLMVQFDEWEKKVKDLYPLGLIVSTGFLIDSLLTPLNEIPVRGIILIDLTIAYLASQIIYKRIIKTVYTKEKDFKTIIYLALAGYYAYESFFMLSLEIHDIVIPWLLNVVICGIQLIAFIYALYVAGDKI